MWNDISKQWQTAFEEAWEAFCTGSIPIGAAVFDENGDLILKDHNRTQLSETINRRIAHAEANILRQLDTSRFDPQKLTLYTTMEPCPMCMGTAAVSNIRHLRSAAHDPHCGMIHLIESEPYFIGTLQSYYELRCIEAGASRCVFDSFSEQCPEATEISERLYKNKVLDRFAEEGTAFGVIFDYILSVK